MGIFDIFKKVKPSVMDAVVASVYGNKPRGKQANLLEASHIACVKLLFEIVKYSDVHALAKKLFDGPMPYSTHDLAVSTSLGFFKNPELFDGLKEAQIVARLQVAEWCREGIVVVPLAQAFEDVLYKLYKPILSAVAEKKNADPVQVGAESKTLLEMMKEANRGTTAEAAAEVVSSAMTWQCSVLSSSRLGPDYCAKSDQDEIEKAFLFGLTIMASEVYDILDDENLLLLADVTGMHYAIDDDDEISSRIDEMWEAAKSHEDAFNKGYAVFLNYLTSGKNDDEKDALADLINENVEN